MFCKTLTLLGMMLLGGCAGQDISTEQPSFYASMASPTAKLDAEGAASMISEYRRNNGLGAVAIDPELMKAAETQSQAMANRNKMDHDVAGPFAKRLKASGFDASKGVENISAGYHTMAEAFSGWRDSPSHKANMLATGVTKMGIAAVYAPNSKYKVFWTMILASPDGR
ncbi:MAG: CAP domain-containing protein [Xanthobacteraceae bacterium]|nr:CAP domain-containing protein [Xanthobacteraceae bacterium]